MSIMFLSTTDYPSGQIIEFNIKSAKDGKNKQVKAINDELIFLKEINLGKIFKRKDNGDLWYVDPKQEIARFITFDRLELFYKWDKQTLLPTNRQLEIIEEIGGLPSPLYSLDPDYIQFPAKVTTNNGLQIDLCLLHFSQAPPFQRYFKKVLFLSDILDIQPSELSLSYDLRFASTLVNEIRMAFSPFMVRTNTNKFITYNGTTQFVSTGEIKGNEIISEVEFSHDRFDKINDVSFDDITFVIGKWDNRMEDIFKKTRQEQEKKSIVKPKKYSLADKIFEKVLNFMSK